ncbi:hypothetical protein RI367_006606 [Sorochytrium milnesiophthora]
MDTQRGQQTMPPEIVEEVLVFAGVDACAAVRHLPALRRLLTRYVRSANYSSVFEQAALKTLLDCRWSAGVQAMVKADIGYPFQHAQDCDLGGIVLPLASIQKVREWISITDLHHQSTAVAVLSYSRLAAGLESQDLLKWGVDSVANFVPELGEQYIKHGCTSAELRAIVQRMDAYVSERYFAVTFLPLAARHGRLDLVQELGAVCPELISEQNGVIVEAAKAGQLEVLQYACARCQPTDLLDALAVAGRFGQGKAARWLYELRPEPVDWDVALTLADGNHVELLESMLGNGHIGGLDDDPFSGDIWNEQAGRTAASAQDVRILQALRRISPNFSVLNSVASDASTTALSTLQWVVRNDKPSPDQRVFCAAAAAGRADIVEWMLAECPEWTSVDAVKHAIGAGKRELAQRLADKFGVSLSDCRPDAEHLLQLVAKGRYDDLVCIDQQCGLSCDEQLMSHAIEGRNLAVVKLLYQCSKGKEMTAANLVQASRGGNLGMVQWVYQRLPANERPPGAIDAAAELGFLHLVKWLHHNTDLPCTTRAMNGAAGRGRPDIVRFLHENRAEGCTTAAIDAAATGGHMDVLEFLHRNRSEGCAPDTLLRLIQRGTLTCIRWLVERYPTWLSPSAIDHSAASGRLDVLQYFHTVPNAPFSPGTMDMAVITGSLELVRWLHDNRTEGCTAFTMGQAGCDGRLSIVQFLHEHGYPQCSKQDMERATRRVQDWWRSIGVLL